MEHKNLNTRSIRSRAILLILVLALAALAPVLPAQEAVTNQPSPPIAVAETEALVVEAEVAEVEAVQAAAPRTENEPIVDRVSVGGSIFLPAGEKSRDAVAVFGEVKAEGEVQGDMVSVFGRSILAEGGEVRGDMVVVFGEAHVDGVVHGDHVVVFGQTTFGPGAAIDGDCVAVFGSVEGDPSAFVSGDVVQVMPWFRGLGTYIREGPLKGRLIPLTSVFAWIVVGIHFVIYLLVALLLPRPVASSIEQIRTKPLQSFGVGLLAMAVIAPLTAILAMTGIGIVLIPFIGLAETGFLVLGKTAFLEFFGLQVLRRQPEGADHQRLPAFLLGFALLTLLYMVPVVALVLWNILRPLSLGAPIMALFANGRRNGNGHTAPPIPVSTLPAPGLAAAASAQGETAQEAESSPPDVQMMNRAGFWIRLAAAALDLLLLCWLVPFAEKYFLLVWVAYHIGMWAWRGTTIGGIICKLKVVRVDGSPIDFGTALVRSLASVFSAVALFLGFFWAGWTSSRQSWHDLIAGTVIVRVPRGVALV